MMSDITIGQFFPGNSIIHKLDPRIKFVLIFAYIVLIFIAHNYIGLALTYIVSSFSASCSFI